MKRFFFFLLIAVLALSACGKSTPAAETATPSAAAETPAADSAHPDITGLWQIASQGDGAIADFRGGALAALLTYYRYDEFIEITETYIQAGVAAYEYDWVGPDVLIIHDLNLPMEANFSGLLQVALSGGHLRLSIPHIPDAWIDLKPLSEEALQAPADTPTPLVDYSGGTPTPYVACSGQMKTRLWVGGYAAVGPGLPNRVRSGPGKGYSTSGQLAAGEAMEILDGPKCANGWTWYKVRSLKTGLTGWTAEGDGQSEYWLIPCRPGSECGAP